jgi:hypothetical protein
MAPMTTEEQRQAHSERMRNLWKQPSFVDKQIESLVRRWNNPLYRQQTIASIRAGRKPMPLSRAPDIEACPQEADIEDHGRRSCIRRDRHEYHVTTVGSIEEWSLRLVGWRTR